MKSLNSTQVKGLLKVGDVLIPGDGELCSFSQTNAVSQVDRILDYAEPADLDGLRILFAIFSFLPSWALSGIFVMVSKNRYFPGPLGAVARMIEIGIKGIVVTLYYSDFTNNKTIHQRIGWDAGVKPWTPAQSEQEQKTQSQSFVEQR